jgi:hypothetical protein
MEDIWSVMSTFWEHKIDMKERVCQRVVRTEVEEFCLLGCGVCSPR